MRKSVTQDRKVSFSVSATLGSQMYVAGTFNDWSDTKTPLKRKNGSYTTTIKLPPGRHEYKFIIDGQWLADPANSDWVPNGLGTINSVLQVH